MRPTAEWDTTAHLKIGHQEARGTKMVREVTNGGPGAVFSRDRAYRYLLTRPVGGDGGRVTMIGLNPSVADEHENDRTIARCIDFARRWDARVLDVVNLSPLVATRRGDLRAAGPEPREVAAENSRHVARAVQRSSLVVAAWSRDGALEGRDERMVALLRTAGVRTIHCLAVNRDGSPRHPLYVLAETRPSVYLRL